MIGSRCGWRPASPFLAVAVIMLAMLAPQAVGQTLTFQRVIELATSRGTGIGVAVADQMLAHSSYLEARNAYIPGVTLGSGLGQSWGFPLSLEGSAPSIFNVNAQSTLLNFAQHDFVRAARTEWNATSHNVEDQRNQAMLDTAVTFAQLGAALAKLNVIQQLAQDAQQAQYVTQQRVNEGVDSKLDLTRANLNAARSLMRISEAQGTVEILKQHLAQLTGLSPSDIQIDPASMPQIVDLSADPDAVNRALQNSPAVKVADEHARSKAQQAKGEHRALYPSVDFAAQYARLAKYNNYDVFYKSFQPNNATVGVAIRFPFLNSVQRAHAEAADAEAMRAKAEADAARNQVSSQTFKLQKSIQQLAAAREVAKLEWELAQGDLDAVTAKLQSGSATLRDQQNARLEVNDKQAAYLDASFDYDKMRLDLMSATGDLRQWAVSAK